MAIKHKVLKDFQFVTNDKKIVILKAKTVLENYKYNTKNDSVTLERDVIDNNPDFFSPIDWKEELNTYIKQNKIPQPAILTKKLVPFIEEMFILNQSEPSIIEVPIPMLESKSTDLTALEVELENKIRKVDIRESKIKEEQYLINKKELELNDRESILNTKEQELTNLNFKLQLLEEELKRKSELLNQMETDINPKIENISQYVLKEDFRKMINDEATLRNIKGYMGQSEELNNLMMRLNNI